MKKIIIGILSATTLLMVGCDSNEENVTVDSTTHYVNTTESISTRTYNGFRLVGSEVIENEDGSYKVVLDIDSLFK